MSWNNVSNGWDAAVPLTPEASDNGYAWVGVTATPLLAETERLDEVLSDLVDAQDEGLVALDSNVDKSATD